MRVNVYTEELVDEADGKPFAEIVTADYISSRTGEPMKNFGLRIFLRSAPELHYIPGRDDDRSAITFWCGKESNLRKLAEHLSMIVQSHNGNLWRDKVTSAAEQTEQVIRDRK